MSKKIRNFWQWINFILGDEIKTLTGHYNRTDWTCFEIWRPNILDNGCKEQCKECRQEEKLTPKQ
tara:strand:- start:1306 stop:1500 length:195 start_codon:yes stop_codon:yes gene_type:complete